MSFLRLSGRFLAFAIRLLWFEKLVRLFLLNDQLLFLCVIFFEAIRRRLNDVVINIDDKDLYVLSVFAFFLTLAGLVLAIDLQSDLLVAAFDSHDILTLVCL